MALASSGVRQNLPGLNELPVFNNQDLIVTAINSTVFKCGFHPANYIVTKYGYSDIVAENRSVFSGGRDRRLPRGSVYLKEDPERRGPTIAFLTTSLRPGLPQPTNDKPLIEDKPLLEEIKVESPQEYEKLRNEAYQDYEEDRVRFWRAALADLVKWGALHDFQRIFFWGWSSYQGLCLPPHGIYASAFFSELSAFSSKI